MTLRCPDDVHDARPGARSIVTHPLAHGPAGPARRSLLRELGAGEPEWAAALSALPDAALRELARTGLCSPAPVPAAGSRWLRESAALTPEQTAATQYAAVLGAPFSPTLLTAVSGWPLRHTLAVLDELVALGIVREDESGTPLFRFRHPLTRVLTYTRVPPGRRITVHAAAAHALARIGAPLPQQAAHLARCAPPGDTEAANLLCGAARQILDTQPDDAADWLRAALRIQPADEDGAAAVLRTRILLCVAASRSGRRAEVQRLIPLVLASPGLPPAGRGRLVAMYARMEDSLGRHREARALLDTELSGAGTPTSSRTTVCPSVTDTLRLRSAALSAATGDLPAVRAQFAALSAGPTTGDMVRRMTTAATWALGTVLSCDSTDREDAVADATRKADLLADSALQDVLDAAVRLGLAQNLTGRHTSASHLLSRALRCARFGGRTADLPPLLLGHAWAEAALGRLATASASAAEAEETARLLDCAELAHQAQLVRGWVVLWASGHEAAEPLVRDLPYRSDLPDGIRHSATALLATLHLEAGRPEESLQLMLSATADAPVPTAPTTRPARWWSLASRAATAAGHLTAARRWASTARAAADASRLPADRAAVLLAEAALAPDRDAIPLLTDVVEQHAHDGSLLLECRVRLLLARRLISTDRLSEAAFHTGLTKRRAEQCGSQYLRHLAVDVQRAIGARHPRVSGDTDGEDASETGLSQRERQILRMVCRGLSNRDIAGALFVSVKTVEAHLTRVFRKTGTRSRAALVATFATARPALALSDSRGPSDPALRSAPRG
ncbi:helix-turn-helix transcriptional regulator [Streptomyces sp. NBC_00370]|uniref:helix-turn-helix transcriptional regulator n=1 Tax=Streptomyces sp. NBC_00370 TaxID=2975728 RepID=UPI002E25DA0C